ncbi:GLPGLI family protein [Algoriphagus faecimaris]|uniref:GLPGLI family protein n=1 Tax=Algoriphagus faecimaris TaxID=686796 RepID=A0A1G6TLX5_9BACT|nr:GLPGLI family protein [Algoriphagus faecimaris]SDD30083.1 GLPGLI family protein [Algoriphagus faecimaris]
MKILNSSLVFGQIKITVFLIAYISGVQLFAQNNNFAFFYEMEYSRDTTDLELKEKELMVLWRMGDSSLFQSYSGYQKDSVYAIYLNQAKQNDKLGKEAGSIDLTQMLQQMAKYPAAKVQYKVLKSGEDGDIRQYRKLFKNEYVFSEPSDNLAWKFTDGAKEILGFDCQLARVSYSGREYFAWFTPEIPFNDGPYIFGGLPGLILELYDADCHYNFKLVGVENREVDFSKQLSDKAIEIDKFRFFRLEDEFRDNPLSQMSESDAGKVSASAVAQVQERLKSSNNRLERILKK